MEGGEKAILVGKKLDSSYMLAGGDKAQATNPCRRAPHPKAPVKGSRGEGGGWMVEGARRLF